MTELNQRIAVTKRIVKEGLMRMLKKKPLEKINITLFFTHKPGVFPKGS